MKIPGTFLRMGMLGCLVGGSLGCDETSPEEPPSDQCVTAADVPDDGNPCTTEACDNGAPVHTLDLGGGALSSVEEYDDDIFLAKYDPDGNHLWSKSFGGPLSDITRPERGGQQRR